MQRHFVRLELNTRPDGQPPQAFGRFEADAPNVRWTGDALHGPTVNGRKAILFAFIVVALAVMLFCDRDLAAVFGHLSPLAGAPHR